MSYNLPNGGGIYPVSSALVDESLSLTEQGLAPYPDLSLRPTDRLRNSWGDRVDGYVEQMVDYYSDARESVLALPTAEQGIDMHAVRSFMARLGAGPKPLLVFEPAEFSEAADMLECDKQAQAEFDGIYVPDADLALVRRDPQLEYLNGPKLWERTAIHELGHAWTVNELDGDGTFIEVCAGFYHNGVYNKALEEGWACLLEGLYVDYVLGGPSLSSGATEGYPAIVHKYLYVVPDLNDPVRSIQVDMPRGAYAATILERLIDRDPEIFVLLCKSRTDANFLLTMQERMDALCPGIYERLAAIDIDTEEGNGQLIELDSYVEESLSPEGARVTG